MKDTSPEFIKASERTVAGTQKRKSEHRGMAPDGGIPVPLSWYTDTKGTVDM